METRSDTLAAINRVLELPHRDLPSPAKIAWLAMTRATDGDMYEEPHLVLAKRIGEPDKGTLQRSLRTLERAGLVTTVKRTPGRAATRRLHAPLPARAATPMAEIPDVDYLFGQSRHALSANAKLVYIAILLDDPDPYQSLIVEETLISVGNRIGIGEDGARTAIGELAAQMGDGPWLLKHRNAHGPWSYSLDPYPWTNMVHPQAVYPCHQWRFEIHGQAEFH